MPLANVDQIEESYHEAGFRTVSRGEGQISFAKKAPVIEINSGGSNVAPSSLAEWLAQELRTLLLLPGPRQRGELR